MNNSKVTILKVASYFNGPVCKAREYYYMLFVLDQTCVSKAHKIGKATFLVMGIFVCVLLTPFTAPIGMAIRGLVAKYESKPYIYLERNTDGKPLANDGEITLVSHNQCYMTAGYSITDGQLIPSSDKKRMDDNINNLKALDPDIICLYEVPDICDAFYISSKLAEYPFIIPVVGVRAIGPSSMMYVASKYKIVKESIEFIPFIKGVEVTGRAQYSEKGFLSFDLMSKGRVFATIISTHLQHSEIPSNPKDHEKKARTKQLNKIVKHMRIKAGLGHAVVLTGDFNLAEDELNAVKEFDFIKRDPSVSGKVTWGGDKWCADLMGKPNSDPMVLDYTVIAGNAAAISTTIHQTGYSALEFRPKALSDHHLLFTTVTVIVNS